MVDYDGAIWLPAVAFRPGRRRSRLGAIILHSTDGHVQGDIETLTGPRVSAHYYVTRRGVIYQLVRERDTAWHAGVVMRAEWGNDATVGIEQEHIDGEQDWPEDQVRAVARLVCSIRKRWGDGLPVLGHATVAAPPGRKQDPRRFPWSLLSDYCYEISGG